MKLYGFKRSQFGMAYRSSSKNRKEQFYDSLKRSCNKRARQEGENLIKESLEDETTFV